MTRPDGYEQAIGADTVAVVLRGGGSSFGALLAADLGVTVISLYGEQTIDALDAENMREAGWVRRDDVAAVLTRTDDLDLDAVHELWAVVEDLNAIVGRSDHGDRPAADPVPRPVCALCRERPVEVEMEGRVLACRPCAEDPTTAEHAAKDWR